MFYWTVCGVKVAGEVPWLPATCSARLILPGLFTRWLTLAVYFNYNNTLETIAITRNVELKFDFESLLSYSIVKISSKVVINLIDLELEIWQLKIQIKSSGIVLSEMRSVVKFALIRVWFEWLYFENNAVMCI